MTACRITHIPTGISAYADERKRKDSYRNAYNDLLRKLSDLKAEKIAAAKKRRRDKAIKDTRTVRTYDDKKGTVTDHRTGKTASWKDVVVKGKIDKLR